MIMRSEKIAWAAGFYEGEGNAHLFGRQVGLSVSQVDREPLDKFCATVGGKVYGPYGPYKCSRPNSKPIYTWHAYGRTALHVMRLMWPHLSQRRKIQYFDQFRRRR